MKILFFKMAVLSSILIPLASQAAGGVSKDFNIYTCTVSEYVSESSSRYLDLVPKISIGHDKDNSQINVPAKNINWMITRRENMLSVEAQDQNKNTLFISSTEEGSNIRVKLPSVKQILNCNAPGKANFVVDPTAYNGEYMTFQKISVVNPLAASYERIKRKLIELNEKCRMTKNPDLMQSECGSIQRILKATQSND